MISGETIEVRADPDRPGLVAQNVGDVRYVTSGSRAFIAGPPRRLAFSLATAF